MIRFEISSDSSSSSTWTILSNFTRADLSAFRWLLDIPTIYHWVTKHCHCNHFTIVSLTCFIIIMKRDTEVAGRLRSTKKYPTVRARTSRYKNSFIPYALCNFQWHFHACMFVYFYCMNVCFVLIQPLGCQNPMNVMLLLLDKKSNSLLHKWQTHLLTINKLPCKTAQQVPARRPDITTTGFSTGKKLPHDGAMRLQLAAPGL